MGTRQVYEEKLRRGNLDFDPTMHPGLGSARCPRCLSLLTPNSAGSGIGGLISVIHALNTGIPYIRNRFSGSNRLFSLVVGVPLVLVYSGLGAAFGGFVLQKFAQPDSDIVLCIFKYFTLWNFYTHPPYRRSSSLSNSKRRGKMKSYMDIPIPLL